MDGSGDAWALPSGLTIDKHKLRELWLPAARNEAESVDFMWGMVRAGGNSEQAIHLIRAWSALETVYRDTVRTVRGLGGLLLIGGSY
jgi:hypothetical protein